MKTIRTIVKLVGIVFLLFLGFILLNHFVTVSDQVIASENIQIKEIQNQQDTVVCTLKANRRKYRLGESPDLSVSIINKLDTAIVMVGSLDGSEIGFRPPMSYYKIRHKMIGKPWSAPLFCATVNSLRIEEFKNIESNQEFDPYEALDDHGYFNAQRLDGNNFYLPGIYELTYHHSTRRDLEGNKLKQVFDSKMKNKIIDLWNKVPNLKLSSNTITIEYNL